MTAAQTTHDFFHFNLTAPPVFAAPHHEKSSDHLVYLLQQKSEKGFSLLYDNYADALFNVLFTVVKNTAVAEDLLQESFIKIWTKIHTYDKTKGTLYTWMLNIAKHTAIDFMRLRKNQFHTQLVHDDNIKEEQFKQGSYTNNAERLDYIAVKNKVAELDKKYASVLDLLYFEGCTCEQTATLLQLPVGSVKTRARKALSLLKNRYK